MAEQQLNVSEALVRSLDAGAALVKLENQEQMMVAYARPRDEAKILAGALKELEIYSSAAQSAIYTKPVGRDDHGKMQHVTGLSIRAAENLGNRWCNSSYGVALVSEDADSIILSATWVDYEQNTRHVMTRRVSKSIRRKDGTAYRLVGDRLDTHVAAQSSKLLREVILRSLPAGLKEDYREKAMSIMRQIDPGRIKTMLRMFEEFGVTQEMLEFYAGKSIDRFSGENIAEFGGLYNALKDGEISVEDTFGDSQERMDVREKIRQKAEKKTTKKEKAEEPVVVEPAQDKKPAEKVPEQTVEEPEKKESTGATGPMTDIIFESRDTLIGAIVKKIDELKLNKAKFSVLIAKTLGEIRTSSESWTLDEAKKIYQALCNM